MFGVCCVFILLFTIASSLFFYGLFVRDVVLLFCDLLCLVVCVLLLYCFVV